MKYSLRKKKKQAKLYKGVQASGVEVGAEGEEGERTSTGGVWLSRTFGGKGLFLLLVIGDIKVKVRARIGISSLPLESKPSRSPLSADLIPQTRYGSFPLNNQSFLPLKVPSQPMALLGQAFNRAHSLGSFAMGAMLLYYASHL